MSRPDSFQINVAREFPHLPKAPIVEALIQWQASPSKSLDREDLKKELAGRFSAYSLDVQQR